MVKNVVIIVLLAAIVAIGYYVFTLQNAKPAPSPLTPAQLEQKNKECPQIITLAKSPTSGVIKDFPTPCDVPKGWEMIENDIPSMDLQVQ